MNLNFLGIGSAFNPELGNTSCYYKEKNNILLIDCGSDVYSKIRKFNILDDINTIYIFCTHTHQDHIGSMATLISWCSLVKGIKVFIVLPNDTSFKNSVINVLTEGDVYLNENYYILNNLNENIFSNIKSVKFFNVTHCERIKSYGIKFILKNKTFLIYSGDSSNIQTILTQIYNEKEYNLFRAYVDCNLNSLSKINTIKPHELLKDLVESIPLNNRKLFYTMHYDSLECITQAKKAGFMTVSSIFI